MTVFNKDKVKEHYKDYIEDNRATSSRFNSLEFHYTKKLLSEYITSQSKVIELGCGTGYYGMYFADKCTFYTGIDLSSNNIEVFNKKISEKSYKNVSALVGNATNVPNIPDNSFDVVLCLGPMYHLPHNERLKVFKESYRIAKKGAILAYAYINSIGVYTGFCLNDEWREQYPNLKANTDFLVNKNANDIFFYTSPEEMEADAKKLNLNIIKNRGLDFFFAQSAVNKMSEEQFNLFLQLTDKMSESESCTGLADHALLICVKQ